MIKKVFLLMVMLLLLVACGAKEVAPEVVYVETEKEVVVETKLPYQDVQKGVAFHWVLDYADHPVHRIMTSGFVKACQDYGLECEVHGVPGANTEETIALREQCLVLGSSGQLMQIGSEVNYISAAEFIEAGVPVVATHFPIDEGRIPGLLAWVAPDQEAYSIDAGNAMAEKLDCGSPIAITQSSLGEAESFIGTTFRNTYLAACPDAEVLPMQVEGIGDPAQSILLASSIIQANPDLAGAFSTTGGGSTTWAKAAEENGREPGEITIISMDYSRANLDLVKSGEVYMLVGQPLFEEYYMATILLLQHNMGLPVPYENKLPAPLITIDDVDKYYAINDLAESLGD